MERDSRLAEEITAAQQICPVVHVPTVGRAPPSDDDARLAELRQVVRDQVLRFARDLDELTDTTIAPSELTDQMPAQRIAALEAGDAPAQPAEIQSIAEALKLSVDDLV